MELSPSHTSLNECIDIIDLVASTASTKEKEAILKDHKDNNLLRDILFYTYNPFMRYKVSTVSLLDSSANQSKWCNLFDMLDELSQSSINDFLRSQVNGFLNGLSPREHSFVENILTKDIRANFGHKIINKVWPGLIPTHEIMLAKKFEGELTEVVAVTTKMDGMRCAALVRNNTVQWLTRTGLPIEGLSELSTAIINAANGKDYFIDGELLAENDEGLTSNELFNKTRKIVGSKADNKQNIRFFLFDSLPLSEYFTKNSTEVYKIRRARIEAIAGSDKSGLLVPVTLHNYTDDKQYIKTKLKEVVSQGEEGLMLNLVEAPYDFKRSATLLKVKQFYTADLKIIGVEEGTGKYEGKLGSLIVDYKGNVLNVGSGFSDKERDTLWANRQNVIGRVVETKYFEETKNEKGGISLRFPTFVRIREVGKTVSYF